jgi:hypothetical protein
MTKPMITIHNVETDEIVEREMTDKEYADYQSAQGDAAMQLEAQTKAETDKAALLAKLGITADEAKLLLS